MFDINGKLMEILEGAANLIVLNILFLLCCIPVITIGASKAALYDMAGRIAAKKEGYLVRGFFQSFIRNFRVSTIIWVSYAVCMAVLAADIYVGFSWRLGIVSGVLVFAAAAAMIAVSMTFFYALALQGTFENSVKNMMKNAFLLAAGHLPATVIILAVEAIPAALVVFFTYRLFDVILFFAVIGFALQALVNGAIFDKLFQRLR